MISKTTCAIKFLLQRRFKKFSAKHRCARLYKVSDCSVRNQCSFYNPVMNGESEKNTLYIQIVLELLVNLIKCVNIILVQ